ncbi:RNA cytidine acetyltransferase 1-like isoform X2 [Cucumis melo]|nr:RNA cytidine acetyltransferase 1-like isoform X2 [Cucumis melo]XP_050936761.1 RNA cytidine acetyltransferase 1-like isoform X2 [Cucumis melo]
MRKKVDDRIRSMIQNGVKMKYRSFFVIIGDKARDQVVNLHYLLSNELMKSRPTVLWCYKNKLEISSHKRKRAKQVKKLMQRGLLDPEKVDPFLLFSESGGLSYCQYKDSDRILGNTYGMCVLQDFEALTPNILARTIETVEGGGLVVMLLNTLSSLTTLCTMVMDIHERYRTEAHAEIVSRFNERFLLSLASCKACMVMDDELNILPLSSRVRALTSSSINEECRSETEQELKNLKDQLHDVFPIGLLVRLCTTLDQGKAVSIFLDTILDKTPDSIVALIAPRGRGKSAALGIAIVGAIASGYSNIFVTAPTPENLKSLFEFICKALKTLQYEEHLHYNLVRSSSSESRKTIVQVNIYKQHRQTIQYILPNEYQKLSQAELLVIDEAAAIPLPVIRSLLGSHMVFLSSTVNGYEGTGRSLSLKLLRHLEKKSQIAEGNDSASLSGRKFCMLELQKPIRYASGDHLESWLNSLLCLDVTSTVPPISRLPLPSECNLYYVNRDTLFSFHKDSEIFLQRMMALYVASHYKNSPNDLQLMADAPAHHLFVLLGPVDELQNVLPDILCVIQVCLEGQISRNSALQSLQMGRQPPGDQIPWKFCQVFRDTDFPSLSGARVVRIAVHPSALREGYGSTAMELLTRYYEGKLTKLSERECENVSTTNEKVVEHAKKVSLQEETIVPKQNLPPLLVPVSERSPEKIDYVGASFGLTTELFGFWKKLKFLPFYISRNPNDMTGECSCMVLRPLNLDQITDSCSQPHGLTTAFYKRFRSKFILDVPHFFRDLDYKVVMSILDPKISSSKAESRASQEKESSKSPIDLASFDELEAYVNNQIDYKEVFHVATMLAQSYFDGKLGVTLSAVEASILSCVGLQLKDISSLEVGMNLGRTHVLSKFYKLMKKFYQHFKDLLMKEMGTSFPQQEEVILKPHEISVDADLYDGARQVNVDLKAMGVEDVQLQKYGIENREAELNEALQQCNSLSKSGLISVKSSYAQPGKLDMSITSSKRKRKH